mmetsp:Transcript_44469/g.81198  ORF Transcript_44469/g.81198 Transcript_44469/m.81198 type:complete len:133 (+) Transcript_44469:79-477(+)
MLAHVRKRHAVPHTRTSYKCIVTLAPTGFAAGLSALSGTASEVGSSRTREALRRREISSAKPVGSWRTSHRSFSNSSMCCLVLSKSGATACADVAWQRVLVDESSIEDPRDSCGRWTPSREELDSSLVRLDD